MFATEGVPRGRPASPRALSRRLPVGRIHSGRPPSVYHQTPPEDVCNGGGSTGEACLPPCTFTRRLPVGRIHSGRPPSVYHQTPPEDVWQRRGFHGGGLPPRVLIDRDRPVLVLWSLAADRAEVDALQLLRELAHLAVADGPAIYLDHR